MKRVLAVILTGLSVSLWAQAGSLTLNYAKTVALTGGASASNPNAMTFDAVSNRVIFTSYSATAPCLYLVNPADGTLASPGFANFTWDPDGAVEGAYAGFSAAAGSDGAVYMYDQTTDPDGRIQRLDSISDLSALAVSAASTTSFSRNLSIEGSGADTWICSAGSGDSTTGGGAGAFIDLLKASDASLTNFTRVAVVKNESDNPANTGKAGAALSPPEAGQAPLYMASTDLVGDVERLRVFKQTGLITDTDGGYTKFAEVSDYCAQAQFDLGDATHWPVVFTLVGPSSGTPPAQVAMHVITNAGIQEYTRVDIPAGTNFSSLFASGRGSLDIDRTNKALYAFWRGSVSASPVIAKLTYVLPEIITGAKDWQLYE